MPIYPSQLLPGTQGDHADPDQPLNVSQLTNEQYNGAFVDENGVAFTPSATDLNRFTGVSTATAITAVAEDTDLNGTFDDEEAEAAINANAVAINAIIAVLVSYGMVAEAE